MKKLFILLFLTSSIICFGQGKKDLQGISTIKFYGIDYSHAKVYGAKESASQLKDAFEKINHLFIAEAKKYDVEANIRITVSGISLDAVNEVNSKIKSDDLFTTDKRYALEQQQIAKAIKALPIAKEPGTGMVFIATLLNKSENQGTYQVVFFNTNTKEVITNWEVSGKAAGFGLRNYWAKSIHGSLKKLK